VSTRRAADRGILLFASEDEARIKAKEYNGRTRSPNIHYHAERFWP
jgi:hypothetical protein